MFLSDELVKEITSLGLCNAADAYQVRFVYSIFGKPVRGGVYPPRTVLYRTTKARYESEGHGHRIRIDGSIAKLTSPIFHDDRKSLKRWFTSQISYAELEASMLSSTQKGSKLADKLRRTGWVMPVLMPLYVLFFKGGILSGRTGWHYALQRAFAEIALALEINDRRLSAASNEGQHSDANASSGRKVK